MARILIIEDQSDIALALAENLRAEGFEAQRSATGLGGLALAREWHPEVIILDLMLPDIRGEEVLATLRAEGSATPVLILSARSDEATKVAGFRIGADDYVTKPFGLLELLARIARLARRTEPAASAPDTIQVGRTAIRPLARQVLRDGEEVTLRPKEMDLLLALLAQANRAVSRRDLLRLVWRYDATVESRTVDWHVAELRRKLEDDPDHPTLVQTVRKVGYRLDLPAAPR